MWLRECVCEIFSQTPSFENYGISAKEYFLCIYMTLGYKVWQISRLRLKFAYSFDFSPRQPSLCLITLCYQRPSHPVRLYLFTFFASVVQEIQEHMYKWESNRKKFISWISTTVKICRIGKTLFAVSLLTSSHILNNFKNYSNQDKIPRFDRQIRQRKYVTSSLINKLHETMPRKYKKKIFVTVLV